MLFRRKRNDFFRVHTLKKRKNVAGLSTRLALPTLAPGLLPVLLALAPGLALATTHLGHNILLRNGIIRATATPSARPTLPLVLLALVLLALALGLLALPLGLLPLALTAKLGRTC